MAHEPVGAGGGEGLARFDLNDARSETVHVDDPEEKELAAEDQHEGEQREPQGHRPGDRGRPAEPVIQALEHQRQNENRRAQLRDDFLFADSLRFPKPALDELRVAPKRFYRLITRP